MVRAPSCASTVSRVGDVELRVPWVVLGRRPRRCDHLELALLAGGAPPVVDQLVAGDPDQPRRRDLDDRAPLHRRDRGQERLGREVLGQGHVAAARQQVAVDLGQGPVVQREQRGSMVGNGGLGTTHIGIIAPRCGCSDGSISDCSALKPGGGRPRSSRTGIAAARHDRPHRGRARRGVTASTTLVVVESMKMEHVVAAEADGVVGELRRGRRHRDGGRPLVALEPERPTPRSRGRDDTVDVDAVRADLAEVTTRHAVGLDERRPDAVARRRADGQRTARENVDDLCDDGHASSSTAPLAIAAQRRRRASTS